MITVLRPIVLHIHVCIYVYMQIYMLIIFHKCLKNVKKSLWIGCICGRLFEVDKLFFALHLVQNLDWWEGKQSMRMWKSLQVRDKG